MSLQVSSNWTCDPFHGGCRWKVEAKDDNGGFEFSRSGGTLSGRAARRAIKRNERSARRLWRTIASDDKHGGAEA